MLPAETPQPTAIPPSRTRVRLLIAAKALVSIGLLAFLFSYADMSSVLRRLSTANPLPLIVSFVLLGVQTVISSIKWRLILRSDGLDVPIGTLVRVNATSTFVSLFLPSSFGGDIYRVAALKAIAGGLVRSTASVLFDRGSGLFALVTISVVSYLFFPDNSYSWAFILAWLAAMALFAAGTSARVLKSTWWPRFRLAQRFRDLVSTLRVYRKSGRLLVAVMGLSMVFQFMMVVVNSFYAGALGIDIAFSTLLVIIPLIYLTEVIPFGINGIGIRDGAFVIAFAAVGRPADEALAISLLLISMRYLYGFSCGLLVLAAYLLRRPSVAR